MQKPQILIFSKGSIRFPHYRSKRVIRQNTEVTRVGGGQLCRGICMCAWGAEYRHAFFLMLDLLIWWQLNGMWGYLLFERLQCVQTVHG